MMFVKTAVVCEVGEGCALALGCRCSGFPPTTCGNDGGGRGEDDGVMASGVHDEDGRMIFIGMKSLG